MTNYKIAVMFSLCQNTIWNVQFISTWFFLEINFQLCYQTNWSFHFFFVQSLFHHMPKLFYNVLTQRQSANGQIISTLFLKCFISSKQKLKLFLQANFTWIFSHQLNWHSQLNAANLQLEQKPTNNLIVQYFGNYFPAIF